MASHRRTARNERIPPDGFNTTALEAALHGRTPPPASLVPLPFQGRQELNSQYRQGQQPALASHRRTARNERIPPDGFDTTALESTLYGRTPPPASLVPLPFQGRQELNSQYRQGQQPALASHRRTARNERIPPDGFDTTVLEAALHRRTSPPFFMDGIHGKLGFHLPQQQNYNQPQQTKSQQ